MGFNSAFKGLMLFIFNPFVTSGTYMSRWSRNG